MNRSFLFAVLSVPPMAFSHSAFVVWLAFVSFTVNIVVWGTEEV